MKRKARAAYLLAAKAAPAALVLVMQPHIW
jgi:hypothetical protein